MSHWYGKEDKPVGYYIPVDAPASEEDIRRDFMEDVCHLVNSDRNKEYGSAFENFNRIADMWGVWLDKPLTPQDVCAMMIMLKLTRLKNNKDHRDSWLDLAGYACLGATTNAIEDTPKKAE